MISFISLQSHDVGRLLSLLFEQKWSEKGWITCPRRWIRDGLPGVCSFHYTAQGLDFNGRSVARSMHTETRCEDNIIRLILWVVAGIILLVLESHTWITCSTYPVGRWVCSFIRLKRAPDWDGVITPLQPSEMQPDPGAKAKVGSRML